MEAARGQRIVVVEDDPDMRVILARLLTEAGYEVQTADDVLHGIAAFESFDPDLVLLDINLASGSGLDVLQRIRDTRVVPVIVVSGGAALEDRVGALDLGAVDYLMKPFDGVELIARVGAQLRDRPRSRGRQAFGDGLEIDFDAREVARDGERIPLTPREFGVLAELAGAPGQRRTRADLLRAVWASTEAMQDPSTVNVHIRRLRRKLERDPERPRWIRTAEGRGYRFDP